MANILDQYNGHEENKISYQGFGVIAPIDVLKAYGHHVLLNPV